MSDKLQPGMTLPDFELPDENGEMHRLLLNVLDRLRMPKKGERGGRAEASRPEPGGLGREAGPGRSQVTLHRAPRVAEVELGEVGLGAVGGEFTAGLERLVEHERVAV